MSKFSEYLEATKSKYGFKTNYNELDKIKFIVDNEELLTDKHKKMINEIYIELKPLKKKSKTKEIKVTLDMWKLIDELNYNKNGFNKFQESIKILPKEIQVKLEKFVSDKTSEIYPLFNNVDDLGSDDSFGDLLEWVISQGQDFYESIKIQIKKINTSDSDEPEKEIEKFMKKKCSKFFKNSEEMIFSSAFL